MKFYLLSYKSGRHKEPSIRIELSIEEIEYIYGLVDREANQADALYGLGGIWTRKERLLIGKTYNKLKTMIQPQKKD